MSGLLLTPSGVNRPAGPGAGTGMSHRSPRFRTLLDSVRTSTVRCLGGGDDYEAVLFGASGTAAVESIVCAVDGPMLVLETGRYSSRLASIAALHGHEVERWRVDDFAEVDPADLECALDRLPRVRTLAVVHCETTTGHLAPLPDLCRIAARRQVVTVVDAVGSAGAHPVRLGDDGPDWTALSSSKAVEGLPGLSMVVARTALLERPGNGCPAYFLDARRNWLTQRDGSVAHTLSVPLVIELDHALRRWTEETPTGRSARYAAIADALRAALRHHGFDLVPLPEAQRSNVVVPVRLPPGVDFERVQAELVDDDVEVYFAPEAQRRGYFFLSLLGRVDPALIPSCIGLLADRCGLGRQGDRPGSNSRDD